MSNIITLTTDMGDTDFYVAALKGKILKLLPQANIVDISHKITPFNIAQSAFTIKNAAAEFPDNTIHILGISPEIHIDIDRPEDGKYPILMQYKSQYFIGADNGQFALLLGQDVPEKIIRLDNNLSNQEEINFPIKNIFIPVATALAQGEKIEHLGSEINGVRQAFSFAPVIEENVIKGSVVHIDHYGNVLSNIAKGDFERVGKRNPFAIYFRSKDYFIEEISNAYGAVPQGEKLALFSSSGFLEIAINQGVRGMGGGASDLFGLKLNDIIRVEFYPKGSAENFDKLF